MKKKIAIYLAGSIQKGHEKSDDSYWTEENIRTLRDTICDCEVSFLNPALRSDDLSDQLSVFGRDMLQVFSSNAVFVDARNRRGLGVGAEMMWAKVHKIPLVIWAPKDSHYHKSSTTLLGQSVENWIHPFVESLSDKMVQTVEEGAEWIVKAVSTPNFPIKGLEHIEYAMEYYKKHQLHRDGPMQELIQINELLRIKTHIQR
jgi:hypothetical protein